MRPPWRSVLVKALQIVWQRLAVATQPGPLSVPLFDSSPAFRPSEPVLVFRACRAWPAQSLVAALPRLVLSGPIRFRLAEELHLARDPALEDLRERALFVVDSWRNELRL
jgi:hypothetical protein